MASALIHASEVRPYSHYPQHPPPGPLLCLASSMLVCCALPGTTP